MKKIKVCKCKCHKPMTIKIDGKTFKDNIAIYCSRCLKKH